MNFSIKYRPLILKAIVGHNKIKTELQKRSKDDDFPNVMIFTGKTGTGKTTLQKIIAKNILCKNKDEFGNACNKCEICSTVIEEKMSNYYYEYNASNLNIDDMRQLEETAIARSLNTAAGKVIVIDELQELSANKRAQKNILKLLEKPIKNTYFILGAMTESKVDKAILNRAVKYRLQDLTIEDISTYLMNVCMQEQVDMKDEDKIAALLNIAQNSDGSVRTAISYLERVIYSDLWKSEDLMNDLGIVSQTEIINWINGFLSNDASVLNMQITVETLEKINYTLLIFYKKLLGVYIPQWQQKMHLSGLTTNSIEKVKNGLLFLNNYLHYTYTNQYLIDFVVLNAFNEVNKSEEIKQVRRRSQ